MPDKFNELASFLDAQLDKLHVLANKPQDVDFEDVTSQPQIYTWKDEHACRVEENEFIAFAERRTNTLPRSKQEILDEMAFIQSLNPEEKEIYRKLKAEQKLDEMAANKAEVLYKIGLTTEEKITYNELKEEERQAQFNQAVSKKKFI